MVAPLHIGREQRLPEGPRLVEIGYGRGWEFPEHEHPNLCVSLVVEGAFEERYRGTSREAAPGTVVVYREKSSHRGRIGASGAHVFQLELPSDACEPPRDETSRAGLVPGLARELYFEFLAAGVEDALVLSALAQELAVAVHSSPPSRRGATPRWMPRVLEYLRAHLHRPVTLVELSREAGLHPSHFAREFRRYRGTSVGDYQRRLRVALAAQELSQSSTPLAEIAYDLGYADQSHLGRHFKRFTGMTPAEYRGSGAKRL